MSVSEVKQAVEKLTPEEKTELFQWLTGLTDFQALQELRREIAVGLAEADEGKVAPLDMEAVKREARKRVGQG